MYENENSRIRATLSEKSVVKVEGEEDEEQEAKKIALNPDSGGEERKW